MQLPPLDSFTPETGGTPAGDKQDAAAGFSEALALALGAGLSLFDPSCGAACETQETLLDTLAGEDGSAGPDERVSDAPSKPLRESPESEGAEPARESSEAAEGSRGDGESAPRESADAARPLPAGQAAAGIAPALIRAAPAAAKSSGLEVLVNRGTLSSTNTAAKTAAARPTADLPGRVLRVVQILRRDGQELFRGTLRFNSKELGELRMEIEMKDEALRIRFLVAGTEQREAVEAQLDRLREGLGKQGFGSLEIAVELGSARDGEAGESELSGTAGMDTETEEALEGLATHSWDGLIDILA